MSIVLFRATPLKTSLGVKVMRRFVLLDYYGLDGKKSCTASFCTSLRFAIEHCVFLASSLFVFTRKPNVSRDGGERCFCILNEAQFGMHELLPLLLEKRNVQRVISSYFTFFHVCSVIIPNGMLPLSPLLGVSLSREIVFTNSLLCLVSVWCY